MINQVKKWGNLNSPIFFKFVFFILFFNSGYAQEHTNEYYRFSISVGFENLMGFQMDKLPYGLQYAHKNQIVPAFGINYDFYKNQNINLRTGARVIRIIEKEFFLLSTEYTKAPYDFIYFINTSTGSEDYRYEMFIGYDYKLFSAKNADIFIGTEALLGYQPKSHPSILEFYNEYNGFESSLIASHTNPNKLYGKLGAVAGINFYTNWMSLRLNFYYHYRLQNFLEGTLTINNSNNEKIESSYSLKGDSYGIGISVYPKKRKKNN